ncbi:MAG: flagellar basal body rod protein FlgB [Planctomycetota bacterium]|jgi:flagellar basal-body rod protein FlgB
MRIGGGQNEAQLLKLLELTGERSRALNGNVANINTPGYKRREVRFEEALRSALDRGKPIESVQAETVVDETSPARIDGNNVDLERELALRAQNGVLRDAYLTMLETHYRMLDAAVRSGR